MVEGENILLVRTSRIRTWLKVFLFLAVGGLCCGRVSAALVSSEHAHKAVKGWLTKDARPFGSRIGNQIESVETFSDANGQPIYYVVYLRPNGFVIVPADDEVEPVICFAQAGSYDSSQNNPLGALVSRDLPARVDAARAVQKKAGKGDLAGRLTEQETAIHKSGKRAFGKWNRLLGNVDDNNPGIITLGLGGVSDVRVSPLLQSQWSQTTVCSSACYNYYTPPGSAGSSSNYPCGCVATAMAQYMRFWQYPTTGVGTTCFTVYVNGSPQTKCLRGGNGSGGAYDWANMVLVPDCSITTTQKTAIGALTYDAGVAVHMQYAAGGFWCIYGRY